MPPRHRGWSDLCSRPACALVAAPTKFSATQSPRVAWAYRESPAKVPRHMDTNATLSAASAFRVERLRAEYAVRDSLGIGNSQPRLSWVTVTDTPGWHQAGYEIEIDGSSCG